MVKRILKTLFFGVAMTTVVAFSAALAGCNIETKHPEVKITVEFNSVTYELEYTLYRNMYPQTVRHFIELADNGFYDDMIVHDYTSNDWSTGAYSYSSDYATSVTANSVADYLENSDKEEEYLALFNDGKLTPSVYSNRTEGGGVSSDDALPTLMGEFYNNINQEIENGSLSAAKGTLKMLYYTKETNQQVYVTPTSDQIIPAHYKYNCATSVFSLQVGSSSSYSATDYCTFATINDEEPLDDLLDAIADYISDNYDSSSDFVASATVEVDNLDDFSTSTGTDKGISKTFSVAKSAIVIKSVKVTKY